MARRKNKTSIALPEVLITRLDRIAKAAGKTRSGLIRDMIDDGIEQQEMMVKATTDPVIMAAIGKVMSEPGFFRHMAQGLRTELTDEQLELFRGRLEHLGAATAGANAAVAFTAAQHPAGVTRKKKK